MKILDKIIVVAFLLISNLGNSQDDDIYILLDTEITQGPNKEIVFGFSLNSRDKRFVCDYYQFKIPNIKGFGKSNDLEYYTHKELREEIKLHSINYETLKSLHKRRPWELHEEFSLKKIYLLQKEVTRNNNNEKIIKYYYYNLEYEGTRKNLVITDMSKN